MKLYEFEGKRLFRKMGIPVPEGDVAASAEEASRVAASIGYPVALKSQILGGRRGKTGGIQFAETEAELKTKVLKLLGASLAGETVHKLLIEKKVVGTKEFYAGITLDPRGSSPVLMVSDQGGMEIEELADMAPERVHRMLLDPIKTIRLYHLLDVVSKTGLSGTELVRVSETLLRLISCYYRYQAVTAEINPLIIGSNGGIFAADSKLEIDDSALFRLTEIQELERPVVVDDPLEAEARREGLSYVAMENGNIGIISGGAGLAMASMDMVFLHGGRPANFLDLGGGTTPEKAAAALRIVLKTPGVKGVLFNVFGGINNCEQMAKGIAKVIDELHPAQSIVVKMRGYSQEEGWQILESRNVPVVKFGTTEEAVKTLLAAMERTT
ncbi:MAG: ADP-forming succinate--CoA ligase subunit beta [Deltaproteobacteria bacterium]|nr:ADP-forming succinate--CoA ligase subunit beta [Deltaproteobacteria bacterium]MBW1961585.1 ADP-forming succinate--CoA ligase subunit beta [Deltaproteobacteria bacterium]MBW1994040.1 ADP-forming succinate--CoA ligase subunit beta [Deltaproteobacteria bacterium]MBW2152084.1 ADP-forming succinate--CoA ligase subunit beta [Deltaproteobacteria bacterium]